jgi:transcriptional regulator with XRE-family HTH domain
MPEGTLRQGGIMADAPTRRLADYVRRAALAAGYDVDKPRGGGKLQLAADAGMSPSTLSRLLSGDRMPDPRSLEGLALALRVPVLDLLVEGGVVSEQSIETRPREHPLTPEEAADALGIHDEADRQLFTALIKRLGGRSE